MIPLVTHYFVLSTILLDEVLGIYDTTSGLPDFLGFEKNWFESNFSRLKHICIDVTELS